MLEAASHALPVQLRQGGIAVPAAEAQAETGPGGEARSLEAALQPSVTAVHPVSAAQQSFSKAVTSMPIVAAAEHGKAAAVGEQRRLAGTSRRQRPRPAPLKTASSL